MENESENKNKATANHPCRDGTFAIAFCERLGHKCFGGETHELARGRNRL